MRIQVPGNRKVNDTVDQMKKSLERRLDQASRDDGMGGVRWTDN